MKDGVNLVTFLEVLSPGLTSALGVECLQLLLGDLVVEPVQHTIVVQDGPTRQKKIVVKHASSDLSEHQPQIGFQQFSTCFEVLNKTKLARICYLLNLSCFSRASSS